MCGDESFIAMEEVLINREDGGGLDPVEKARDAVLTGDVCNPREKDGVNDAGDRVATGGEGVEDVGEVATAETVEDGEVVGEGGVGSGNSFVVAVGEGGEGEEVVVEFRGGGGEHAAMGGDGGGEGDVSRREVGETVGEVESRVYVALGWESGH